MSLASDPADRRARRRLALGALAGVVLAAVALLRDAQGPATGAGGDAVPDGRDAVEAVAWIDGEPISREAFARLAAQVAREHGALDLDDGARRALLERLIDEELLLREGLALGLARREPLARRAIVSAVVAAIGAGAGEGEPDRAALAALYEETRERWRQPGELHVEAARVPVPAGAGPAEDAAARARAESLAARARAGESLAALAAAEGVAPAPPLPSAPLPQASVRARLAAPAFEALAALAPGEVSEPVRAPDGWWVVQLVARGDDEELPFEAVELELRNLWLQREHERAVRAHLDALRARSAIEIVEPDAGS